MGKVTELNPYEVLGVRRNATERMIRDAYRRLSRTHHPDAGGSTDQFAALANAMTLLTDAPRRAWYDEHGWDRGPDTVIRGRAIQTLATHIQAVLMADEEPRGNLLQHMRLALQQQLEKQRSEGVHNHDKVLRRLNKLHNKFRVRGKTANEFASILAGHKMEVEKSRRGLMMGILVNETALRILEDYTFEEDMGIYPQLLRRPPQYMSTSTSGFM